VFRDPRHPYTAALAGAFPQIGDERFIQAPTGLDGDPPDPRDVPSGCSFHTRCPIAQDICRRERPPLASVGNGQSAACHFAKPYPIPVPA